MKKYVIVIFFNRKRFFLPFFSLFYKFGFGFNNSNADSRIRKSTIKNEDQFSLPKQLFLAVKNIWINKNELIKF